jgi:protein-S-isoprenylcysteine O-methyltransferase Ste14
MSKGFINIELNNFCGRRCEMLILRLLTRPLFIFIAAVAARHVIQLVMTRSVKKGGEKSDFIDTAGLFVTYVLVFATALISLLFKSRFDAAFLLGFLVMETSVIMRLSALRTLGEYFSYEIRIAENHKLINTGVYSVVRHPLHLAFLGEVLGMAIISGSSFAFIVTFILALVIIRRNRIEDEALRKKFREDFDEYAKRVPSMNIIKGIRRRQGKNTGDGQPSTTEERQEIIE